MIDGLIIDSFAGGGGASTGIEAAFAYAFEKGEIAERRFVNYAVNHDREAISMHATNHPHTQHLPCNIWQVEFDKLVGKRKVALMWFSPDCKHFSKAKGGKPVKKEIRDLAWVVVKAARQVRPAVIMLENVEEFQDWGPLIFKRTGEGRTIGQTNLFGPAEDRPDWAPDDVVLDENGQPVLIPDPDRKGQTFKRWTAELVRLGYHIEWKELRACDYGAPTIRKRFFMIARRDGKAIVWPKPTHGDPKHPAVMAGQLLPWRTAAEIIDWSLPCPSIFLTKTEGRKLNCNRPLAEATMERIRKGVKRYVLDAEKPFIVNLTHQGSDRNEPVDAPMNTVTGARRGEKAVVSPVYVGVGGRMAQSPEKPLDTPLNTLTAKADGALVAPTLIQTGYGERAGQEPRVPGLDKPLGTVVAGGVKHAAVAPILVRTAHGERDKKGKKRGKGEHPVNAPLPTQTASPEFGVISPHLMTMRNAGKPFNEADKPTHTITSGGAHLHLVAPHLTKFRANSIGSGAEEPVPTVTANSYITRPGGAPPMGVVSAFLAQNNIDGHTGEGNPGRGAEEPVSTVLSSGSHQGVVATHMLDMHGSDMRDASAEEPVRTLTAQGYHAAQVAAFLTKYYGPAVGQEAEEPVHTATSKPRFGLVTVEIYGQPYIVADIGLRMLTPRELFRAQGFPESYIIDVGAAGEKMTKTAQVRMCGNSVCPQVAEALVRANLIQDVASYVRPRGASQMECPLWQEDQAA